jgi:hypothetical protein
VNVSTAPANRSEGLFMPVARVWPSPRGSSPGRRRASAGLGAGLLGRGVDRVALLPEKLRGSEEGPRHLLPAQDVAPLVYEDREVAVALDPVLVEVADDALARRPDGEPLLELLPACLGHPRHLGVEALDVLGLFLEVAFRDEKGESTRSRGPSP